MKKALKAHTWDRDQHDWYVEPKWCAERLFDVELFDKIHDPACGRGTIVDAALARGYRASGSDIVKRRDHPFEFECCDFLTSTKWHLGIVSNPPFGCAEEFVRRALTLAPKVAMLLPALWMTGQKRASWLKGSDLRRVDILTPRPSMPPGHVIEAGQNPTGGKKDFAWFVWDALSSNRGEPYPELRWLDRDG